MERATILGQYRQGTWRPGSSFRSSRLSDFIAFWLLFPAYFRASPGGCGSTGGTWGAPFSIATRQHPRALHTTCDRRGRPLRCWLLNRAEFVDPKVPLHAGPGLLSPYTRKCRLCVPLTPLALSPFTRTAAAQNAVL